MSRVALIGENSVVYVSILLDIWNNGDCAVLLDWRIPFATLYRLMLEANVTKCYIERRILEGASILEKSRISFYPFDITDNNPQLLPDNVRNKYHENMSNSEAAILYSSGTTGKSKGIILSHYAITANADAILDYMKLDANDCLYITKSLSHSSTLTGELVVSLRSRAGIVLAPTVVPPRYILSRLREFSVTTFCLNPTLLRMLLDECRKKEYDLGSLKTIYCSGACLNDKVYSEASDVFKKIDIFNVYGLSEAGPRVTAQTKERRNNNSVGKAIEGVEVVIIGDDGIPANNSTYGIIHVNTPSRYNGYISGAEKHKSLYRNWLNTGDIGYIDEFGELHIVGRVDDIIIVDSHKIYPEDIERLILENAGVIDCAISKFAYNGVEMIGCLYVSESNMDCTVSIIRNLKEKVMYYEIPKRFLRVNSIPHNIRGKICRAEVERTLSETPVEKGHIL